MGKLCHNFSPEVAEPCYSRTPLMQFGALPFETPSCCNMRRKIIYLSYNEVGSHLTSALDFLQMVRHKESKIQNVAFSSVDI